MTPMIAIAIGLVGGAGALARFVLDGLAGRLAGGRFPFGTLLVNVLGALVLGGLVGIAVGRDLYRVLGTGLIGAFTTYSTWAFESHRLGEDGQLGLGILNLVVSLALGLGAAWAGRQIAGAL